MDATSPLSAPLILHNSGFVASDLLALNCSREQVNSHSSVCQVLLDLVKSTSRDGNPVFTILQTFLQAIRNIKGLAHRILTGLQDPHCRALLFNDCFSQIRQKVLDYVTARNLILSFPSKQVINKLSLRLHQTDHLLLEKPLEVNLWTCAVVTIEPLNQTYVTGGETHNMTTKDCIQINHASRKWRRKAEMQESRQLHGAVYINGYLYVFGGKTQFSPKLAFGGYNQYTLKSVERLSLHYPQQQWQSIESQMSYARHTLNPCVFELKVYLALGGHPSIDVFCTTSQTFQSFPLPNTGTGPCITVMDEGTLILLSTLRLFKINPVDGKVLENKPRTSLFLHPNTPSLVYEGRIYASGMGELWILSVDTGERMDVVHCANLSNNKRSNRVPNTRVSGR